MKHQKELLARPWPETAPALPEAADWQVETAQFNHWGRRVLEARFSWNRAADPWNRTRRDFRVFLAKTAGEFVVQFRDGVRFCSLADAMCRMDCWSGPRACSPWIGPEDEARIARTLGAQKTQNHQLDNLDRWMAERVEQAAQARREMSGYIPDELVAQCPEELPEALEPFIRRTVLPEDDTLLYKRGNVRGLCFRCGRKVRASGGARFRQYQSARCPSCGETVSCVLEGGADWRADYAANVAFCQRGEDGETVFVRLFHLLRDPSARYERLTDWLTECARYAFRGRRTAMWLHEGKEPAFMGRRPVYRLAGWERSRRFYLYDGPYCFMEDGAAEAFRGSRLQYCQLDAYLAHRPDRRSLNPIRYLAEFVQYPVLEFLWKAGYRQVVDEAVQGLDQSCRNCLRWKRPTVREAFPFPMRLLDLKPPEQWTARDFQRVRDLLEIAPLTGGEAGLLLEEQVDLAILRAALPHMTVRQLLKYRRRQGAAAFALYGDYLRECGALGLDLTDKAVLFPPNLLAAHERTAAMAEYEAKQEEIAAFARQSKTLEAWSWARDGLLIRPAASLAELKAEGKALRHCVAGYAPKMARGETAIFLVRRTGEPEKPFYTLELQGKRIVQCRTDHNAPAGTKDPAVWAFVTDWLAQVVLAPRRSGKRAAQGQRMEECV